MMVGEGVDEELNPEEDRPVEEWPPPPPPTTLELTNKDGTSRLLFLTVQYVGDEAQIAFEAGLDGFAELEQRVVSPLDPNMGCTACYSPVYRPPTPLMPAPVSPTANYLDSSAAESGMIVLEEQCPLAPVDNYNTVSTDAAKLLLLSSDPNNPTEMVVTEGDPCGDQKVEFMLSNGTIAYGIVEPPDANGARVIQIPTEYLVATRAENTVLPTEVENTEIGTEQEVNNQDDTNNLRALYNTLKEQGLIIESGDLRLEPDLESGSQLIDTTLLEQPPPMPLLQSHVHQVPQTQVPPPAPLQKRFWCEECNVLLESDCREHQIDRKISDKHVPSRARATLPASYLVINKINDSEEGVFARKTIPKRTQFGPIEGLIVKPDEVSDVGPCLELTIETASGELNTLDVSNEHMSNWMRFVRMATTERPPNLLLSQLGLSLYFTTTHMIHSKEELLVWYSPSYALRRNLPPDPPPQEWPCSICGVKLKTSDELTKHALHHQKKNREENLTVYTLRRKNKELIANVKKDISDRNNQVSRKMRYECVICSKKFPRCYSLKRHIYLLHTRENKYHCKICHLGFSHSFNRLRHMRKAHPHHKDVVPSKTTHRYECWSCSHCDLTFNSASMLNLHTLVHAADNIEETEMTLPEILFDNRKHQELVACPQCSMKFSNKRKLASHVAEHGKNRDPSDKKFHCEVCGRNFISAVRFQSHKELHIEDANKPLQCHVCMKRLLTKSALSCHLKIHDCSVQWECPMCKEHFGNVLALRSHVHSHAVQGFYHCPHCEKSFEEYSGIRKHIRAFHSARKHICSDCDKRFPTQDKLRMHLLKHSDDRQFLCDDCGKQFKRNDKLKEHMKRMHKDGNNVVPEKPITGKKVVSKVMSGSTDYERYIYKCHSCLLGFKRRGMLVNHLANRHPDITPDSVPELNLPILKTTRDYYCQYCDKIYKSSSKRKAHILKNHPGLELPMSNRQKGGVPDIPGLPNPTFSQTVGSITTNPHGCQWCHKQYASKAKLLQHQRKKHAHFLPNIDQAARPLKNLAPEENIERGVKMDKQRTINLEDIAEQPHTVPSALSANINNSMLTDNQMHEYEIIATDYDGDGLILSETPLKRPSYKNDNISSDLLSQAMSEIGVNLSELRALSSEQCLKLLGGPCEAYTPYPAR